MENSKFKSFFHDEVANKLEDETVNIDQKFDHLTIINQWTSNLDKAKTLFISPYNILSVIKVKLGSKENAKTATVLTYPGSPDANSVVAYQRKWVRDEDIESFVSIIFGPKTYFKDLIYTKSEIENAIEHHLKLVLPNQILAQQKYFNYFKLNYIVNPGIQGEAQNDLELLYRIISESIKIGLEFWVDNVLHLLAELIRQLKITDPNHWRYKNLDGFINKDYDPFLPIDTVDTLASGILKLMDYLVAKVLVFIDTAETSTEDDEIYLKATLAALKLFFKGINKVIHFLLSLIDLFIDILAHFNAFIVGVYNGIIEFIAGIFDLLALVTGLIKKDNRDKLKEQVGDLFKKFEEKGFWGLIRDIIDVFIQKYKDAPDSYEIAKILGEDIIIIAIEFFLAWATGGAVALKKLKNLLTDLKNGLLRRKLIGTKKIIDDVLSGNLKLDEIIDEFGKIRKRKKGDYTRHSNFAEMVSNERILLLENYRGKKVKFELISDVPSGIDDKIKKGIDAIYENKLFDGKPPPPKYLVNEVKANVAGGLNFNPLNSLKLTKYGGRQMSRKWISKNLENFSEEIRRDMRRNGYDPVISGMNMDGTLHSMTLVDDLAKGITKL